MGGPRSKPSDRPGIPRVDLAARPARGPLRRALYVMFLDNATVRVEVVRGPVDLPTHPSALLEFIGAAECPALLDSSAFDARYGRFSLLTCSPLEVLTLRGNVLRDGSGNVLAAGSDEALWAALARALRPLLPEQVASAGYVPGWIGYVGYEVARHVERLPGRAERDTALPDLRLAFHDAALVYDAAEGTSWLVELRFSPPPPGAGQAAAVLREAVRRAAGAPQAPPPAPPDQADAACRPALENVRSNFPPKAYRRAVRRCIEYIAAGDIYQVNLSQRLEFECGVSSLQLYEALRRRNPAWYAAYLRFEAAGRPCAVLSSSPELFLRLRRRQVTTRPIKGTRARVGVPQRDAAARADLLASPKDNAELAMIIDLLRNDLGRVCEFGTVRVVEPRRLEAHPTVFHLVGTVEGVLRDGVGAVELLRAAFPGGSITGAPKIRAMEIIDELEGVARGVYTGCIGIVAADGACEWNIAIRTIVCDGERALLHVGGGIVADSDPQAEYEETLHKARALREAIAEAREACAARSIRPA